MSARDMRAILRRIAPGGAYWFQCPGHQPFNRVAYLRLNGVAYRLWGRGGYRMMTGKGEVGLVRRVGRGGYG